MRSERYIESVPLDPIDRWCRRFAIAVGLALLLFLIAGCAGQTVREHEEQHCSGLDHGDVPPGGIPFIYEWTKTRPASAKPWTYLTVANVDSACRMVGADPHRRMDRIVGCAIWKPVGCTIFLQE